MDDALDTLLHESAAKCAMVIDRTGVILSSSGDFHPLSQENMGAVAAGVIAALNTMVSRASSPEVSVKFYGADVDKIHYVLLAERLILCMLHNRQTTSGQIRQAARQFMNDMLPLIQRERTLSTSAGQDLLKSVQYIESKLNELFLDPG
jgi:predicted regulator of Ras-like GTPase activity (Roadblock/LC7/MglB family)